MQRVLRVATVATLAAIVTAPTSGANTGRREQVATSAIEGLWKTKRWTVHDLLAGGVTRKDAETLVRRVNGTPALDFRNGRFKGSTLETGKVVVSGTYRVSGSLIRLVFTSGPGVRLGQPDLLRWSVYRDRLTFSAVPGRPAQAALRLRPWTRVT